MELPYNGRATIIDEFDHVKIIIPAKRNSFITVFLCFWMCGWVVGEVSAINGLLDGEGHGPDLFTMVWLGGWTVGGIFAFKTLWWLIAGKEIIEAGKGFLEIKKQGELFSKQKVYDLNECKSFRTVDNSYTDNFAFGLRRGIFDQENTGTIVFDYGMQTIKFAEGIDEAEGKHILNVLKSKGILKGQNF